MNRPLCATVATHNRAARTNYDSLFYEPPIILMTLFAFNLAEQLRSLFHPDRVRGGLILRR